MRNKLFILIFAIITAIPCSAFAAPEMKDARIGDVTKFTGDVLVRTNGNWRKLTKTPYPIYSSDKVVTNRGRAEVSLADGGILKMDTDSNISISRRAAQSGIIFKKTAASRQVNVLIGNVWFDVDMKKDGDQIKFKTPQMVAAIKGTVGCFGVAQEGDTKYGLTEGEAETSGEFIPYNDSGQTCSASDTDTPAADLPPSDPGAANSEAQQAANEAAKKAEEARLAGIKAKNLRANLTKGDPIGAANIAVAQAEYGKTLADAKVWAAKEVVEEARRLGKGLSLAQQNLAVIEDAASQAAMAFEKTNEWAVAVTNAATSPAAQAAAAAAQAYASRSQIYARAASSYLNVAEIGVSDNDPGSMSDAQTVATKIATIAHTSADELEIVANYAEAAANAITNVEAQAAAEAAAANAWALFAKDQVARANANIAMAISAGDTDALIREMRGIAVSAEANEKEAGRMAEAASRQAILATNATTEAEARLALVALRSAVASARAYAGAAQVFAADTVAWVKGNRQADTDSYNPTADNSATDTANDANRVIALAADPIADPGQAEIALQSIEEQADSVESIALLVEEIVNEFDEAKLTTTTTDGSDETGSDSGGTGGPLPAPSINIPGSGGGGGGDSNPASPT